MSSSAFNVRRAVVDDLPALRSLWEAMQIPNTDLEKRLTEFQVAVGADGEVVGSVGFQISGRHGLIHSEAFTDFSVADQVRELFWKRLGALALNHGVARFWTRESSPFWTQNGLLPAEENVLNRLPAEWDRTAGGWLTLRLKDEDAIASMDREFDMFVAAEKRRTEQALGSVQKLKSVVVWIVCVLALALMAYAAYLVLSGRINLRPQ